MIILILAATERRLADPVAVMCSTTAKRSLHLSALLLKSIAIFLFAPCLSALLCHFIRGSVSKTLRGKKASAIAAEELGGPAVLKRNTAADRWLCNSMAVAVAAAAAARIHTGCRYIQCCLSLSIRPHVSRCRFTTN